METLAVAISTELKERLEALSVATDRPLSECLTLAVQEFVDHWEIHLNDLGQIDQGEARTVLKAANE